MAYQNLILLAPCHGLEDFPLYHTGDDAASLLASWTALWHPVFMHSTGKLPHIERCDYPPDSVEHSLLILPAPCEAEMDSDLPEVAERQNATLLRSQADRKTLVEQALEPLGSAAPEVDEDLVRDFFALGFAYLQVELLTQQMRYASTLDQSRLEKATLAAAQAAVENDAETCRLKLTACFDALADERSHYYPVDVFLLDVTLLAPETLGDALQRQLTDPVPQNLLLSGETTRRLAQQDPQLLQTIRQTVEAGGLGIVGGEQLELPLPLMSLDSALRQLQAGNATYREYLGRGPSVYGRRRSGLFPTLPGLLARSGFGAALHFSFDGGRCPDGSQCKTRWEDPSEASIDALVREPLDASLHETFLNLPSQLSDSMDMDHVATRMFAHWPGRIAPWYDDLRRSARYGTALGRFVTLDEYFAETGDAGNRSSFLADDYRYRYLQQAVASQEVAPLSRWVRYWRDSVELMMARGAWLMSASLGNDDDVSGRAGRMANVEDQVDRGEAIDTQVAELLQQDARAAVERMPSDNRHDSITVLNTLSFPRRALVETTTIGPISDGEPVYAACREADGTSWAIVDVPPMGFVRLTAGPTPKELPGPPLVEDLTLRNEFLQAQIDPHTGSLRSLKDYRSRKTRISQQVALRMATPKTGQPWIDRQAPATYSVMSADAVEVTRAGKTWAEITSRGRLLDTEGEVLGEFIQRYRVTRGSRVLELEIELTPRAELLPDDPWDSYYACRFAWNDEAAVLRRGTRLQSHQGEKKRFEAPLFIDVDCASQHHYILSGGLPYHRRVSAKQLDTLLLVEGETARTFRLGIGVDLPYPARSAIDFLAAKATTLPSHTTSSAGWLYHIDAKNVIATWWEPLEPNDAGFRVRLLETEGRATNAHLRSFRPIQMAQLVDGFGEAVEGLTITEGNVEIAIKPHQFVELRLQW